MSPSGLDRNEGTCASPWRTLQKALDAARPGQIVVVRAGTYRERLLASHGGRPREPITLRAAAGERVVVRGQLKITASHLRIVGLVLDGAGIASGGPLIYIAGVRRIRIERVEVRRGARSGVFVGAGSQDVTILASWIHDNGQRARRDHGIVFERGAGGAVESTVVSRNRAVGVLIYPDFDGVIVNQNTIVSNGASGVLVGGETGTSDDVLVVNNILAYNGGQGVRTFWGGFPGMGNVATNNLIWGNRENDISRQGMTQDGNFFSSPGFARRQSDDYHLRPRSPAVNQAIVRYTAPVDRDGRRRPAGQRPDLGAFER